MSFATPLSPKRLRKRDFNKVSGDTSIDVTASAAPYITPFKSRNQTLCHPNLRDSETRKAVNKLEKVSFKRYARFIKGKLLSRLSEQNVTEFEVSYASFSGLQLTGIDHEAIRISVIKRSESGQETEAYSAVLLSWGASQSMQPKSAVFLPVLLCRGLKSFIKQVHLELQLLHDCFVSPFDVNDDEMRFLTVGVLHNSTYEDDDKIKLDFNMPQKTKIGTIDIELPASILTTLWRGIHETTTDVFTDTESSTFWDEFHHHTKKSFGIDCGFLWLEKVILPDVMFTKDAIFSRKKGHMHLMLSFVMSMNNSLSSVAPQVHEVVLSE